MLVDQLLENKKCINMYLLWARKGRSHLSFSNGLAEYPWSFSWFHFKAHFALVSWDGISLCNLGHLETNNSPASLNLWDAGISSVCHHT